MPSLRHSAPAVLLLASSCGPTAADFRSPSATSKLDAIVASARAGDDADVTRLIEQLESDDPAVRMSAEAALRRRTGDTYGYRHYDSPDERRAAIERWTEDLRRDRDAAAIEGLDEDG